jgi:siroheme synthase
VEHVTAERPHREVVVVGIGPGDPDLVTLEAVSTGDLVTLGRLPR